MEIINDGHEKIMVVRIWMERIWKSNEVWKNSRVNLSPSKT